MVQRKVSDSGAEKPLQKYAGVRRDTFLNIANPMSQANMQRVCQLDPEAVGEMDPFLKDASRVRCRWVTGSQKPGRLAG